jgi:hypothetical protein
MMGNIFGLLILLSSFLFGLISINKPEIVLRFITVWLRFVSGGNFFGNQKMKEALLYIDDTAQYYKKLPEVITTIQRTGYIALFVAFVGLCLALVAE